MIIHRTLPDYRDSIRAMGLIPQYQSTSSNCPHLLGYVSASIDYGYFGGFEQCNFDKFDYWEILRNDYITCYEISKCKPRKRCDSAVVIKGLVSPDELILINKVKE